MKDGSTKNLIYELKESHVAFDPDNFVEILKVIFPSDNVNWEYTNTATFKELFREANIKIKSIDNTFPQGKIPKVFAEFMAWNF